MMKIFLTFLVDIAVIIAISIILATAQQIFIRARNHIQNFLNFERLLRYALFIFSKFPPYNQRTIPTYIHMYYFQNGHYFITYWFFYWILCGCRIENLFLML